DFSRLLDNGVWQRFRRAYDGLRRELHLDIWFPHIPLALATAIFGIFRISPDIPRALGMPFFSVAGRAHTVLVHSALQGVPATVAGIFLLVMSVGLSLRSKLAWATVILLLIAGLVLTFADYAAVSSAMLTYNALLLAALLAASASFYRSSLTTGTLFALTSILAVLVYAVFGSYQLGADFVPPITDFTTALYFSIVTMSTVGYGDIIPETAEARLFVVSIIVLGISVFAASLSAVLMPVINRRVTRLLKPGKGRMERTQHYIIVGKTALARNTYKELHERKQQVTFIREQADGDTGLDVVVGDSSNLDVLRQAGAHQAKAVLALSDDDSRNAFVVLAMRELAESIKTVVAVNDARNLASVKRVHPDLIISPQILGGELLAMALSGEPMNTDKLINELLHFNQ
ncbi:MAG: voltage-gated potassium channel protein, partial [Gammaproteobacteria bacterium]